MRLTAGVHLDFNLGVGGRDLLSESVELRLVLPTSSVRTSRGSASSRAITV